MTVQPPAATLFRRYDIRGITGSSLTPEVAGQIARAFAAELLDRGEAQAILARDARLSSPGLADAFIEGLLDSGLGVIDIGAVPTPVAWFATHHLGVPNAVVVTGSHNPKQYNGFKLLCQGLPLHDEALKSLWFRILKRDIKYGSGRLVYKDVVPDYLERIIRDIRLNKPLRIAVDCGNGIAGITAPELLQRLGCKVTPLYCDPDGHFPNHHPNPSDPANLEDLKHTLQSGDYDLGLAFDGDGDRIGVMDSKGGIIWPDRQMILFSQAILEQQPGATIIYDVKSTTHLETAITLLGGHPIMSPSGHALIRQRMVDTGAALAGELSGHIFFRDRWYGFDDGLYAAARMLELVAASPLTSRQLFATIPDSVNTPELNIDLESEARLAKFMQKLMRRQKCFHATRIHAIDGLRIEYRHGWGLVRASNTMPALSLRFEADDEAALKQIQNAIRGVLLATEPGLMLPF